ncbi:MAG TPA: TIGR03960 family B12-binding radical SAM protein [Anaerolineales bacterium]|nr:TIGR03960 family B12-binding radical SAM protein [Anaerolineales bacterium]
MRSPEAIELALERILLRVQKPGRYVGGEFNTVRKSWDQTSIRTVLVFPDIYDIGISNIGLKILYDQINQRSDALAERAYAPWTDMEALMREAGLPLYSLESKRGLADFDLVGFSLPYETLYTNTLNLLDLAGIPLRSADRDETHPIVIAGGHAATNPEPMHAFIDAFVIGEGEEVIHEILEVLIAHQAIEAAARPRLRSREAALRALAKLKGVYVPRYYRVQYLDDGTVRSVEPLAAGIPQPVVKRILAELPPPPTNFIVPNIETVHNRVSVEIMRGCTRGCRFCQAGMITRPVRERSIEEIVSAAEQAVNSTGFEELALLSLSSSDFGRIVELTQRVSERFKGRKLTVSLPSLRIESVSIDLMDKLREHYSGGFTLAPEAATERMRRIINKYISDQEIVDTSREIYRRGWTTLKLYFMIGHPSETLEDVRAIAHLCKRVIDAGRSVAGWKIKLHAGVSTFVPKPQTPFQWVPADRRESILAKQALLKRELRDPNIKLRWTEPEDTLLEAWLSRGDRRMAEVVFAAWRRGAKFDAWNEKGNAAAWAEAFAEQGLDPAFYTHRPRRTDEVFPWDHISAAVRKNFLFQDFRQSLEGQIRVDCRLNCYACGILPTFSDLRRTHPGEGWKCPDVKSPGRNLQSANAGVELPMARA